MTFWAAILTAAMSLASSPESRVSEEPAIDTAADQLISQLLDENLSRHRPPLTSDDEHARTIDPVLTENAAVWIHEAIPAPPLTVMGGRVFTYRDVPYDPLDAPLLKIRPIDDGRRIPFLIRVVFQPEGSVSPEAVLRISVPAPPIFNPRVADVAAWVGPRRAVPSIDSSAGAATIDIRVPLATVGVERPNGPLKPVRVIVEGELLLDTYGTLAPGRFRNVDEEPYGPAIGRLAGIEVGRDAVDVGELRRIHEIAATLAPGATSDYEKVVAVNSWVASSLRYRESPSTRSPLEILEDRSGDCDDHTALLVTMLRAMGIVARPATGLLYDLNTLSAHAWVEVALPTRDRDLHWFIVDPTLAGAMQVESERSSFVQFKDRILLYPFRPMIGVEGAGGHRTTDVLFNWRKGTEPPMSDGALLDGFTDLVVEGVDRDISRRAEELSERGPLLRRRSSSIAGSPYLIVDRPVAEESDSRLEVRLENEERLVVQLVAEPGLALESKTDHETISLLSRAYSDLNGLFFAGVPAHLNLELIYTRDRHTDRLHTVSLRVGRYLVEHHLDRILKRLSKYDLLSETETAKLSEIAKASGGKNLYVLQELARQPAR